MDAAGGNPGGYEMKMGIVAGRVYVGMVQRWRWDGQGGLQLMGRRWGAVGPEVEMEVVGSLVPRRW